MKKFEKNFILLLISQIISLFGGGIIRFVLLLFILDVSQSAETFGLVSAITQIPVIVLSLLGGIIADRMNKKNLAVVFDLSKTLLCFALFFSFVNETYSITLITIFITLLISIVTLFQPVLTAAVPSIINPEVFAKANGAIQSVNAISDMLSFVLGGVIYATIGMNTIILISGFLFLISTIIDLFLKIPFIKKEKTSGIFKMLGDDVKESFVYLRKETPSLFNVSIIFSVMSMLFIPVLSVTFPYIIRINLGMSEELYGVSQAIVTMGMILAGLLAGKLKSWLCLNYFYKWMYALGGLVLVLSVSVYTPFFPNSKLIPFWIFNIVFMMIMLIASLLNITIMTSIQESIPEHLLGKVFALIVTITNLLIPIGQFILGIITEALSNQIFILFIGVSIVTMIVAIVTKNILQQHS